MALFTLEPRPPLGLKAQFVLFSQWAQCLRSGIPLLVGLTHVRESCGSRPMQAIIAQMEGAIDKGRLTIAGAFRECMPALSPFYQALLEQGEAAGKIEGAFEEIAAHLKARLDLRGELLGAAAYPGSIMLIFLMAWPIPMAYRDGAGAYLVRVVPELAVVAAIAWFFAFVWPRLVLADGLSRRIDRIKMEIPFAGRLFRSMMASRFASALSAMVHSGIAADRAVEVAGRASGNAYVASRIEQITPALRSGRQLADELSTLGLFDTTMISMVRTGEASGELDKSLASVARLYEGSAQTGIKALVKVLGPFLQLLAGIVVGGYVIMQYASYLNAFDSIR